jgi:acetolactate synthase-1/2/3 large subunit
MKVSLNEELPKAISKVFDDQAPWFVELMVSKDQQRFRASSFVKPDGTIGSRPMEDMDPLLPREELERIMTMFDND